MQKKFLVTGGASGIGAEVAARLEHDGHDVTVLDRNAPEQGNSRFVHVDLADPESITSAVQEVQGKFHGLANVAGVSGLGGSEQTLRVNFLGLRSLAAGLFDKLQEGSGVVSVASRAGHQWPLRLAEHIELADTPDYAAGLEWLRQHPVSDNNAYPYSKEVIRVWTQLQVPVLAKSGIRINVISPGPVATPIFGEFEQLLGKERMGDGIDRAGRPGTPKDIAPVVTWLLSEDAHWVNGADIPVDGGLDASYVRIPMDEQPGISTALQHQK